MLASHGTFPLADAASSPFSGYPDSICLPLPFHALQWPCGGAQCFLQSIVQPYWFKVNWIKSHLVAKWLLIVHSVLYWLFFFLLLLAESQCCLTHILPASATGSFHLRITLPTTHKIKKPPPPPFSSFWHLHSGPPLSGVEGGRGKRDVSQDSYWMPETAAGADPWTAREYHKSTVFCKYVCIYDKA